MKTITTITPKNALKLFLFLLILFSAKAFSYTKLPTEASSSGYGSKIGYTKKAGKITKTHSTTYAKVSKGNTMPSKDNRRFKK
jgi:hypothetical protein